MASAGSSILFFFCPISEKKRAASIVLCNFRPHTMQPWLCCANIMPPSRSRYHLHVQFRPFPLPIHNPHTQHLRRRKKWKKYTFLTPWTGCACTPTPTSPSSFSPSPRLHAASWMSTYIPSYWFCIYNIFLFFLFFSYFIFFFAVAAAARAVLPVVVVVVVVGLVGGGAHSAYYIS